MYNVKAVQSFSMLGLTHEAPFEIVKKQYRKLMFKYHPDRNKAQNAASISMKINECYSYLKDHYFKKKPAVSKQRTYTYSHFSPWGTPFVTEYQYDRYLTDILTSLCKIVDVKKRIHIKKILAPEYQYILLNHLIEEILKSNTHAKHAAVERLYRKMSLASLKRLVPSI